MVDKLLKIYNKNLFAMSLYSRKIAGTFVVFFIARYLSVYDYGMYGSYVAIVGSLLILANLGYSEYILVSAKNNVRQVQLKSALFLLNAFLIVILLLFASNFVSLESRLIFCLIVIRQFFDAVFFALVMPYFQATKKFNTISYINITYSFLTILIAIFSYIFKFSLVKFLMLSIFLGGINFVQCSIYANINYKMAFLNLKRFFSFLDSSIFHYMSVTLAFFLYSQIPSLYVAYFIPKTQAALYFASFSIASLSFLLIGAQVQKAVPEMINKPYEKIVACIKENLKFLLGANLIIFAFLAIFGKWILLFVFKKEYYLNAYYALLILNLSNIPIAVAGPYGAYITASGNQKVKVSMQFYAIVIAVLVIVLLQKYQIYAAAISYFLSALYIGISYWLFASKRLKILKEEELKQV